MPKKLVSLYKDSVCREVGFLLDDKKRIVRKFARNCVNEWQILGNS